MAEAKVTLKELLAKKNPSDQDVAEVVKLLKASYQSKLWPVVDEVLADYLAGGSQSDELDALEEAVGLEGESFIRPKIRPVKLLKTQNSLACGNNIDPSKIGTFIEEKREMDEESGELKCEAIELGRQVKIIPIMRVNYLTVRVEKDGNTRIYRIYPPADQIERPFNFLRKMDKKATAILEETPDLDAFAVKKTSRLFFLAKIEGEKMPALFSIDLSPVDSYQVGNFERLLKQRTGKAGYPQIFKVGKSVIMKSAQVKLQNGRIVVGVELAFGDEPIKAKDDWRVVIIPIAYAIKNYIGKLNHDFTLTTEELEEEAKKQDALPELPSEQEAPAEDDNVFDEEISDEIEF